MYKSTESVKQQYEAARSKLNTKTLRDEFAMTAMNAYIDPYFLKSAMTEEEAELLFENCANFSYRMADAMLKARES
jgi:hypothetical protein